MKDAGAPPRLAVRLLDLFSGWQDDYGAAGDFEEFYRALLAESGARRARRACWRQVRAAFPGYLKNVFVWSAVMLKQYFTIALRNIRRHKGYSLINIAGLTVGLACALFILLWVQDEMSYDRFHANAKTLYRVEQDQSGDQGKFHVNVTPYGMAAALAAEIPEIKDATRLAYPGTTLVRNGEKVFFENRIRAVDPAFLRMFTFPAAKGSLETALDTPSSIALTATMAKKYFGTEDPLGKAIILNNDFPVTVTAVLKDPPLNSTLRFDALLPVTFLKKLGIDIDSWNSNEIITLVQLHDPGAAPAAGEKIKRLVRTRAADAVGSDPEARRQFDAWRTPDFSCLPVVDINLYGYFGFNRSDRGVKTVILFSAIAVFVLLIACINFMNLATARSANRAREVGLRKVVGALRKSIAGQFFGESVLTAFLSGLAAVLLVVLFLPGFNALSGKHMTAASLLAPKFILGILAVTFAAGLVAGSYPALFLSSFQPVRVLKGRLAGARGARFRKILVVIQFALSVLLLVGMGVVSRQIDLMRTKKLGYEKDQLAYLPLRGATTKTYAVLKERLLRDPKIEGVTATYQPPTMFSANGWGATWDGKPPDQRYLIGQAFVDFDYPETMGIPMAAGRSFDRKYAEDAGKNFLVNEEVPKLMGLDAASAVGKRFHYAGVDGTIVGVMKNFHYQSVRVAIEPLAILVSREALEYAVVRLKAGDIPGSLEAVKAGWLEVNPQYPFEYRFFDEDFDAMYRADERLGAVLRVFAILGVAISCLGLFGLASFMAEQRTREIGIRKVLGASVPNVVVLMSKEFAKWVLVANLLAWPVAYLALRNWLQGYAYRTGIAWWLFLLAGGGTLAIALLTVSSQSWRAAHSDPARALKYE